MNGRKPTKAEQEWLSAITQLGCIVCRRELQVFTPAEPHHIDGSRKPGAHLKTIPLCFPHHRAGLNDATCVSRHPYKAAFRERYGSEQELLEATRGLLTNPIDTLLRSMKP